MAETLHGLLALWLAHPVAQTIGLIAGACYLLAALQHHDRKLFGTQLLGAALFVVHYALLSAWSGTFGYIAGTARNLTAFFKWVTPRRRIPITILFAIIYALIAIFTAHRLIEIIPPLTGFLMALAFFNFAGIHLRFFQLLAQSLFIFYGFYVGSIGGVLATSMEFSFTLLTIIRLMTGKIRQ